MSFVTLCWGFLYNVWPFVLEATNQLWKQPFQACAIACHRCSLRLRSEPDNQNPVIVYCYFKTDAPRAFVFLALVKGNEALGTRLLGDAKRSSFECISFGLYCTLSYYLGIMAYFHIHCAKSQIFGPEFARIRIGARCVWRNVPTYSITTDSKYTWNILLESGLFLRIQIEYSWMTWSVR